MFKFARNVVGFVFMVRLFELLTACTEGEQPSNFNIEYKTNTRAEIISHWEDQNYKLPTHPGGGFILEPGVQPLPLPHSAYDMPKSFKRLHVKGSLELFEYLRLHPDPYNKRVFISPE